MSDTETRISPDGRLEATFRMSEMAHGQWVATPALRDLVSGATILALTDWAIDGAVTWGDRPGRVTLALRCWPDASDGVAVHFDVDAGTVRIGEAGKAQPIAEAGTLIADHFAARRPPPRPAAPEPAPGRSWRDVAEWIAFALFMLAGLALLMGWIG
jgi:hypothetical protein